jgi:hypothetical protein
MSVQDNADDSTERLTPEDVQQQARALLPDDGTAEAGDVIETPLTALLTPESRFRIIAALIEADGEPLSVARLSEIAGVSKASFARQKDALETAGVMLEADQVGNAKRYVLNKNHPAAQLLWMADRVLSFGQTELALDEAFLSE